MSLQSSVEAMLEAGACIEIMKIGTPFQVAVISLEKDGAIVFPVFAYDQGQVYRFQFDETSVSALVNGIGFYLEGKLVAYLAPYDEWPEVNNDLAKTIRADWREYLKDKSQREAFERFVKLESEL